MKDGKYNNLHAKTNVNNVDLSRIDVIAESLPMSKNVRPEWDLEQLMGLGIRDINVKVLDNLSFTVIGENGPMILPYNFAIIAHKSLSSGIKKDCETPLSKEEVAMMSQYIDKERENVSGITTVFSDPNRLTILFALNHGPMNVGSLADITGMSVSAVSHSLAELKRLEVVSSTKVSRNVYYRINQENSLGRMVKIVFETVKSELESESGI